MAVVKEVTVSIDRTGYPDNGETWRFVIHANGTMTVYCNSKSLSMSMLEASELYHEWETARIEYARGGH